ncbi:MAG: amidase, partial [Clostridia bacterium]|nr:amidase [Clostridia bacterium]
MYDVREKSILELHEALEKGETTSVELVKAYLSRIATYDSENLNSVLEINPDALFIAEKCDVMRKEGLAEGVMFGIPVMVKDNIDSCDKMHTTAGSLALMNNVPLSDSGVVANLRAAGAILMGKTNMTEYANFMTEKMPSGYSSRGGQVINPYHSVLTPSGSSSGSGVATAASFAAACVGTETNGSIISPSKNNCIVGIKPTVGLVSRKGIIPISHTQDTAGPMARSVEDAAILLSAIAGIDENDETTLTIPEDIIGIDYLDYTKKSVSGMRIGYVVDAKLSEYEQASMDLAVETLKNCGAELIPIELNYSGKHSRAVMCHEFKAGINAYLMNTSCDMKNLTDIRNYNLAHSKECLKHNQTLLDECDALSGRLTEKEYLVGLLNNLENSQGTIDRV